jgi:hypothetical protein
MTDLIEDLKRHIALHELIGTLRDQRVMIAVLPEMPELAPIVWTPRTDRGKALGLVLYQHRGELRVLDVESEDGSRGQRWWKVVAIARTERMDTIPVRYDGPASDIPERYLMEHPNEVVLMRLADRGPWFQLQRRPLPPPEARGSE